MEESRFTFFTQTIENTLARQDLDRDPDELYAPIRYVLGMGGKRLRPVLCLAGNQLFKGALDDAIMPALALEVFHNFTLVHDDIMDEAALRRGKKTVHEKWDLNRAVLSGDAMLIQAYQYLAAVSPKILKPVLQTFTKTATQLCEGQQMDMNFEARMQVGEDEYLTMIQYKTAVLLGAALKIGALTANVKESRAEKLNHFGVYAGLAFQIQDDWLDAFGSSAKVGKMPGGDILQEKKTLLAIYTQEMAPEAWQHLKKEELQGKAKVKAYKALYEKSGAKARVEQKRDALLEKAFRALSDAEINDTDLAQELRDYTQWLAHRRH